MSAHELRYDLNLGTERNDVVPGRPPADAEECMPTLCDLGDRLRYNDQLTAPTVTLCVKVCGVVLRDNVNIE